MTKNSLILARLKNAEAFISGFEGDPAQQGIEQQLTDIRETIASLEAQEQSETAHDVLTCLEWAINQLDKLGEFNAYTLGMVQSIEHCRRVIAREKGGAV